MYTERYKMIKNYKIIHLEYAPSHDIYQIMQSYNDSDQKTGA